MKIPEFAADASAGVPLGCSCVRKCRRWHFIQGSSSGRWPGTPTCLLDEGIAPTRGADRGQRAGGRGGAGGDRSGREGERGKRVWVGTEKPSMRRDSALHRAPADEGRVGSREFPGRGRRGRGPTGASARVFRVSGRPKSTPGDDGPWTSARACSLPPRANLMRSCPSGPCPMRLQRGSMGAHVSRQFHGPWSVVHRPWLRVNGGYHVRAGRARMRDGCRSDFASPRDLRPERLSMRNGPQPQPLGRICSRQCRGGGRRRARLSDMAWMLAGTGDLRIER
jgi:hypothetical protein